MGTQGTKFLSNPKFNTSYKLTNHKQPKVTFLIESGYFAIDSISPLEAILLSIFMCIYIGIFATILVVMPSCSGYCCCHCKVLNKREDYGSNLAWLILRQRLEGEAQQVNA